MDADVLVQLGLTKREAHAYLALLKLEEAKAGEIAQSTKEDRTNVYDSLAGLMKKGLVSSVLKNNISYYRIAPPEKLQEFLKEKSKLLEQVLPDIRSIYKSYTPKPAIEVYEGNEGVKTVLLDILKEGKDFVGFGATNKAAQLLPDFTRRYLKEREEKKIHARQIHPEGGDVLSSKYSTFKTLTQQFSGPSTTLVYGDKVAIFLWFVTPALVILIKSKQAAKASRNQFEFMWHSIKGRPARA